MGAAGPDAPSAEGCRKSLRGRGRFRWGRWVGGGGDGPGVLGRERRRAVGDNGGRTPSGIELGCELHFTFRELNFTFSCLFASAAPRLCSWKGGGKRATDARVQASSIATPAQRQCG